MSNCSLIYTFYSDNKKVLKSTYTCILTYFLFVNELYNTFFIENADTLYTLLLQAHANSNNAFTQI